MANFPTNGTPEQIAANRLTNHELSVALNQVSDNPNSVTPKLRKALQKEAARRLFWKDAYEKHLAPGQQ